MGFLGKHKKIKSSEEIETEERKKEIEIIKVKNLWEKSPRLTSEELLILGYDKDSIREANKRILQERNSINSNSKQNEKEKSSKSKYNPDRVDYMLSHEKEPYKSMAIGEHNEHYYFGSILYYENKKVPAVILDNGTVYIYWTEIDEKKGRIIQDEIKDKFGLRYRFELYDDAIDNPWSNSSIKEFRDGKSSNKDIKEIFEKIKNLNSEYIYHTDKRIHSFIACDIISNYFYPLFNCKGRTYFHADFGSGKSKQSKIYQLLSFNSLFASSITPASFERIIESTGGTIIVDNFDNVSEELKPLILQVIEVYYKKGGKTIKSDGAYHRPIAYNGYSPMVINNLVGLPEVTESRCNKIQMIKTDKKGIVDKRINENEKIWNTTKDDLHILALQLWKKVKYNYQVLEVPELTARELERVEAVLTIAKTISKEVYQELLDLIVEINEQQSIKELSDNWEFLIFEYLNEQIKNNETKEFMVKTITKDLSEKIIQSEKTEKSDKLKFSHYVGKVFKSIPLFKKKVIDGWVHYEISRDILDKMLLIKGFNKYLTIPHLTSLNNTNHTNNTNLTYNINNINNNNNNESEVVRLSEVSMVKGVGGGCVKCGSQDAFIIGNNERVYCEACYKEFKGNELP